MSIYESKEFELLKGTSINELLFDILTFDNLAIENVSQIISQLLIICLFYILLIFSIVNFLRLLLKLRSTESFTQYCLYSYCYKFCFYIFTLYCMVERFWNTIISQIYIKFVFIIVLFTFNEY